MIKLSFSPFVLGAATLFAATLLSACSEESTDAGNGNVDPETPFCGPADQCPATADDADLASATATFRGDVFPIFQRSCNDSTCHGGANSPAGDLWLGPENGNLIDADASRIVGELTGKMSETAYELRLVDSTSWQNSFLMLKVDGCQNDAGLACDKPAPSSILCDAECGDGMPQIGSEDPDLAFPLSKSDRDVIRAWIHQGAQDN